MKANSLILMSKNCSYYVSSPSERTSSDLEKNESERKMRPSHENGFETFRNRNEAD